MPRLIGGFRKYTDQALEELVATICHREAAEFSTSYNDWILQNCLPCKCLKCRVCSVNSRSNADQAHQCIAMIAREVLVSVALVKTL